MMTRESIYAEYHKTRRQIARLYNTYTPIREIEQLSADLEIALQNDLERLEQ